MKSKANKARSEHSCSIKLKERLSFKALQNSGIEDQTKKIFEDKEIVHINYFYSKGKTSHLFDNMY